ncbi:MAG TPA: nuclear transport factor 2 family protein [Croceibacterium sp.]|nr:nuclear transport factor 2 family protein [Croceibacterium sp.]
MIRPALLCSVLLLALASPAAAEWKPANASVAQAARDDPMIAAALAQAARMDTALIEDDHAAFADGLADDLVVNNPQNTISMPGDTARLNAEGRIRYDSYVRTIEYAGRRGDLVVLMGEERVTRKGAPAGEVEVRRFTDIWRRDGGKWRLTARQATKVAPD